MIQDSHNVIPVSMAVLLHVLLFGSLFVVLDFSGRAQPAVPLAIKGMIVTEIPAVVPTPRPEPVAPPEPDVTEQERVAAEEQKRLEDQRIEQERLHRLAEQEAERKRKLEEEAERKRLMEAERKRKEEEAEKERQRQEAERRRQEEIERQRLRNEQLRAEAEAQRLAALAAESERLDAMQANAETAYMFAIQQKISRNWVKPPTATAGLECVVHITQLPGGEVVSVSIGNCNGDAIVRQSIVSAVEKASPLPTPQDPSVFDREIRLTFKPTE